MLARIALLAVTLAAFLPLQAQEGRRSAINAYQVQFTFREGGAPAAGAERRYALLVNGGHKAVFKAGNRTPVVSSAFQPAEPGAIATTQFSYLDLGVNIECSLSELDNKVELHASINMSGIAESQPPSPVANVRNPTISQTQLDSSATISVGKPTVIASILDPVTNKQLQVEATVTAVN